MTLPSENASNDKRVASPRARRRGRHPRGANALRAESGPSNIAGGLNIGSRRPAGAGRWLPGTTYFVVVAEYTGGTLGDFYTAPAGDVGEAEDSASATGWMNRRTIARCLSYPRRNLDAGSTSGQPRTTRCSSVVNGTVPTGPYITSIDITSTGPYGPGADIEFDVTFSEDVYLSLSSGTTNLTLKLLFGENDGATVERKAGYAGPVSSGNRMRKIPMKYRVRAGGVDEDEDGLQVPEDGLELKGDFVFIVSFADRSAHALLGHNAKTFPDQTILPPPRIVEVRMNPPAFDNAPHTPYLKTNDLFELCYVFSEAVRVAEGARGHMRADVGGRIRRIPLLSATANTAATVRCGNYKVQAEDADADGVSVPADAFAPQQGTRYVGATSGIDADMSHREYEFPDYEVNPPLATITKIRRIDEATLIR